MTMTRMRRTALGIGVIVACLALFALVPRPSAFVEDIPNSDGTPTPGLKFPITPLHRNHPRNFTVSSACDMNCDWNLCDDDPEICEDDYDELDIFLNATSQASPNYASPQPYSVDIGDGRGPLTIKAAVYPQGRYLRGDDNPANIQPHGAGFSYANVADCWDWTVGQFPFPDDFSGWATEHIMELQTIKMLITYLVSGKLASGASSQFADTVPASFFRNDWNRDWLPEGLGTIGMGNNDPLNPNARVFETLGSVTNREMLVLAGKELNGVKARIWKRTRPHGDDKFKNAVTAWKTNHACGKSPTFIKYLKSAFIVFDYLWNAEIILQWLNADSKNIRDQLVLIDEEAGNLYRLGERWDEFWCDFIYDRQQYIKDWIIDRIQFIADETATWTEEELPPDAGDVRDLLNEMNSRALAQGSLQCRKPGSKLVRIAT